MLAMLRILGLATTIAMTGCASSAPSAPESTAAAIEADPWWETFGSPELTAMVEEANAQNLDVAAAGARVRQAEARVHDADAGSWSGISLGVDAGRTARIKSGASDATTTYAGALVTSYEVDLWGRLRGESASAVASLRATEFDRDAVRLSVSAGTAIAWIRAVGMQERVVIAERNVADAERLLVLVEARNRAGAATPLELAQQRGITASQRRALESTRRAVLESNVALATWLGRKEPMSPGLRSLESLRLPSFDNELPSNLLVRRPDIARAEAQLAAADADIAVARAAMLPSLSLSAAIGTGGRHWRDLIESPIYTLAAAIAAPIFDSGRLAATRDLSVARRDEVLAGYRSSIVSAFAETQSALQALRAHEKEIEQQDGVVKQAQRAVAIAESRYRAGAETLLVLLDSQRTLYTALDEAVELRIHRFLASVDLYKALGGGWGRSEG